MVYLKSNLSPEDRQPEKLVIPDRVQRFIDLWDKNHVEYQLTQQDEQERVVEYWKGIRPETYRYRVTRIDRVRDERSKKEYYFYNKDATVLNENGIETNTPTLTYGYGVEIETKLDIEPRTQTKEPKQVRKSPTYFFEWNPKEVKTLLDGSDEPCSEFYIGYTGKKGQGDTMIEGRPYQIRFQKNFLDGKFEELLMLAKSGKEEDEDALLLVKEVRAEMNKKTKEELRKVQV